MRNKKYKIFFMVMLLISFILGPVIALAQDHRGTRPSLKGIKALGVLIEFLNKDLKSAALNEDTIKTDVELKLRLAGITVVSEDEILKLPGQPYLYVNINSRSIKGLIALNMHVALRQNVFLERNPIIIQLGVETWSISYIGTVGEVNIGEIRESVKDKVDEFINAYLSVNPK